MRFIEKMDKEIYITRGLKKANDDDIIMVLMLMKYPKFRIVILKIKSIK